MMMKMLLDLIFFESIGTCLKKYFIFKGRAADQNIGFFNYYLQ